jgi:hypothetical protein
MSQQTAAHRIPAGWYPDPAGSLAPRWWDGIQWTHHLQSAPVPPPVMTPVAQDVASSQFPNNLQVLAEAHRESYLPFTSSTVSMRPISPRFLPWSSRPGWVLAALPAWSTAAVFAVVIVAGTAVPEWVNPAISAVVLVVALILTLADRHTLLEAGHRSPASAWWFLLSPFAYLIARAAYLHRITGKGWAPVVVWIGCQLAPVALLALVVLALI